MKIYLPPCAPTFGHQPQHVCPHLDVPQRRGGTAKQGPHRRARQPASVHRLPFRGTYSMTPSIAVYANPGVGIRPNLHAQHRILRGVYGGAITHPPGMGSSHGGIANGSNAHFIVAPAPTRRRRRPPRRGAKRPQPEQHLGLYWGAPDGGEGPVTTRPVCWPKRRVRQRRRFLWRHEPHLDEAVTDIECPGALIPISPTTGH